MADITKITIESGTYDIKDSKARSDIEGCTKLNELHQERLQGNGSTYGMRENGAVLSFRTNNNEPCDVMDIHSSSEASTYVNRDSVGAFIYAYPNNPILDYNSNDTTYTATTVTCPSLTDSQIELIKSLDLNNCIFDSYDISNRSFARYTSLIDSFDEDTKTFTIKSNFYGVADTYTGQTYTPENGTNFYIGLCTKVWGANILANLSDNTPKCISASGMEVSVANFRNDVASDTTVIDATGIGNRIPYGIKSRGNIDYGVYSEAVYCGFSSKVESDDQKYTLLARDENDDITKYIKSNGVESNNPQPVQYINSTNINMANFQKYYIFTTQVDSNYVGFLSPKNKLGVEIVLYNAQNETTISYLNGSDQTVTKTLKEGANVWFSDGNSWLTII